MEKLEVWIIQCDNFVTPLSVNNYFLSQFSLFQWCDIIAYFAYSDTLIWWSGKIEE